MTPDQLVRKYSNVIRDMSGSVNGEIMAKVGVSALTFIRERVIGKGEDAKGSKYKGYSTKALLVGGSSFIQKSSADSFFSNENTKWVTIDKTKHLGVLPGGYKQLREMNGRQTDHVDFSMSGRMWADINVISTSGDHNKGIAIIGAKTEEGNDKLAGNTAKRGDILDLSKTEIADIALTYNLDTIKIFKKNGL